jgi:ribosomal protein S18 acetylase RimI-like enzyme
VGDETLGEIQVVPIGEEYIEGFHRCLDSVARERRYLAFLQAPPLASVQQWVRGNIASQVPQVVAIQNKEVVGWCDISPHEREGFTHGGELGMGVRRDVRRRGIGTRLVEEALRSAKERGLERIELEVLASNTPAIKLYENKGFVIEGVKRKARKLDGQYDDLVQMALFV